MKQPIPNDTPLAAIDAAISVLMHSSAQHQKLIVRFRHLSTRLPVENDALVASLENFHYSSKRTRRGNRRRNNPACGGHRSHATGRAGRVTCYSAYVCRTHNARARDGNSEARHRRTRTAYSGCRDSVADGWTRTDRGHGQFGRQERGSTQCRGPLGPRSCAAPARAHPYPPPPKR
jgi:hypothetical protein